MSHRPPQVLERHLARRAVAYIRQSSPQQVLRNQGSADVQRDTRDLLEQWGWPSDRIDLIDDDLGISGSNPGARQGFSWLIAHMKTMHVGIVMVLDSSRLGRNHPDFAQFQHAARLFDVLYAIQTQVFDFNDPNGEFVSAILNANAVRENRARVDLTRRAKRKKAEAGLVPSAVPTGYVRAPDGSVDKHPDQNVRNAIELIVDMATQVGSGRALVRRLKHLNVSVPRRTSGVGIHWEPATWANVSPFIKNPFYKGTYTFGKHAVDHTIPPSPSGRARRRLCPPEQVITRENNHEPYVDPRIWAAIQTMLHQNSSRLLAPPGKGDALVQGLVRCQAHSVVFHTRYEHRERLADGQVRRAASYACPAGHARVRASEFDALVEAQLLDALRPEALDAIEDMIRDALRQHRALLRERQDELDRAERAVAEMERAYLQVDQESQPFRKERLGELWEERLQDQQRILERHREQPLVSPGALEESERVELRGWLRDLPSLWHHPDFTPELRKVIARRLVTRLLVTPARTAWMIEIVWVGGATTRHTLWRWPGIEEMVREAAARGLGPPAIARELTARGIVRTTGRHAGKPHDATSVNLILQRLFRTEHFRDRALQHIHQRLLAGASCAAIADELRALGILHARGGWTALCVRHVMYRMRKHPVAGLTRLPIPATLADHVKALHDQGLQHRMIRDALRASGILGKTGNPVPSSAVRVILRRLGRPVPDARSSRAKGNTPRDALLRRFWAQANSVPGVTRLANEQDVRTQHGNPWTSTSMARKLASLDLREPRKRRAHRSNREGMVSESRDPGMQAAGKKALPNRQDSLW